MSFLSSLSPATILRQLRKGQESSTFERLSSSRHVADLRLIFSVTVIIMIVASVLALLFCFEREVMSNWKDIESAKSGWIWPRLVFAAIADSGPFVGAVGAVGCSVLVWTYQAGSARLGVVDLFACEIATLCRVAAVVDMVPRYIALFDARRGEALPPHAVDGDMPTDGSRFTSQESYFPVFDSSVKDLQLLEADVVDNVTAFYTYMKVMRDSLRKLADIHPIREQSRGDDWHRAICNIVYMQFLGLESARKAVKDLVEFEPTQAEDIFTILLSELLAYGFLREQFKGDLRQRRLAARDEGYRREIPDLYQALQRNAGQQWDKAKDVAAEVMKRHAEIFPVDASPPAGLRSRAVAEASAMEG